MSLIFRKLRWKNFLSTGNAFTELDLSSSTTTLIIGENGAGKCLHPSTVVDIDFTSDEVKQKFIEFSSKK